MGQGGADSNGERGFSEAPLIGMDGDGENMTWNKLESAWLKEKGMTGTSSNTWGPPEGWKSGDGAWKYESKVDANWISTAGDYVYYKGKRSKRQDVRVIPGIGVFSRNKMMGMGNPNAKKNPRFDAKEYARYKCTMGCNNSGGPDEGGWDAGFGPDGTQFGHQSTMVDTPTSLNDPARLANKVPGTGRTLSEHRGSYLDENGYLTHATNMKNHEDETDATDAHFDRQLPDPDFEVHRGQGRILSETNISGRTRKHGVQGGWY